MDALRAVGMIAEVYPDGNDEATVKVKMGETEVVTD